MGTERPRPRGVAVSDGPGASRKRRFEWTDRQTSPSPPWGRFPLTGRTAGSGPVLCACGQQRAGFPEQILFLRFETRWRRSPTRETRSCSFCSGGGACCAGNGEPGRAAPPLRRATSTLQVLSASMVRGGVSSFHTRMLLRGVCVFHDKQRPSRPRFRPAEQSTGSGRSLHSERSVRAQGSVRAL